MTQWLIAKFTLEKAWLEFIINVSKILGQRLFATNIIRYQRRYLFNVIRDRFWRNPSDYDNYLEEVEELILGLMGNEQWAKDQRDKYGKDNMPEIRKNEALRLWCTNRD